MARQFFIPGFGVVNEDGTREYFIPGFGVFQEDQAVAVAAVEAGPLLQFDPKWHTRYTIG